MTGRSGKVLTAVHISYCNSNYSYSIWSFVFISAQVFCKFTRISNKQTSFLFQAFAMFCMSCVTFWVVLWRMVFNSRRFGTLCLFHLHRRVDVKFRTHTPMKMEQTQCSETSAIKHHTPENNPKGYIRQTTIYSALKSKL
jgi:hypothetical protein